MSCPDLKAYVVNETPAAERPVIERHLAACETCRQEMERLEVTRSALMALGEEEIPRRIAFVSDKVFEPRWYQRVPKLVAAAAMLSAAILVHGLYRPPVAPTPPATMAQTAPAQAEIEAAVSRALTENDARHERRAQQLLDAAEKRFERRQLETMASIEANFEVLSKRMNNLYRLTASSDSGGGR